MGMTCDIGQANIDAVQVVFDKHGQGEEFLDAFDWCYLHDNNTLVGICCCCDDDEAMVAKDFGGDWVAAHRAAAEKWVHSFGLHL